MALVGCGSAAGAPARNVFKAAKSVSLRQADQAISALYRSHPAISAYSVQAVQYPGRTRALAPIPAAAPILDGMSTAHDIVEMLPDDVHAEVIEGEVIVNAARGQVPVLLLIDPAEQVCTLFTEPKSGEYSVRQIVKFGETILIPADDSSIELKTENL